MSARSMIRSRRREVERRRRAGKVAATAVAFAGTAAIAAPAAQGATFQVTNLQDAGAGSLRQAILSANADATADDVTFASGLTGQIKLTTGEIPIEAAVNVQGPGADVLSVSGEDASRIFYAETDAVGDKRDPVTISGLTLTKGSASEGGAIDVQYSDVTLDGVTITASASTSVGGAVDVYGSPFEMTDSTVTGNESASGGGAIYTDGVNAEDNDQDTVTIRDSLIADNDASGAGGAL